MLPMLATPAAGRGPACGVPTDGDQWAYEVKWDGVRVLADVREGRVVLRSRTGRDVSSTFPDLAALAGTHADVLLDGEVVALRDGQPSFSALADRVHVTDPRAAARAAERTPVTLVTFDVLRLYGVGLLDRPWQERRESLDRLQPAGTAWQVSPVYADAAALLAATREQGLEGVVAKRRTSLYRPGRRSADWVKHAHRDHQACLVVGWRSVEGDPARMGALLLAVPGPGGELRYAGRAGSGLDAAMEDELRAALAGHDLPAPVVDVPHPDAAGATFTAPVAVVEVRHLGRTPAGRLRQPALRGVRADLAPSDVREE
ncbi:bifunctional non-homologous end joining protein LigD [Kineococcus aurantiacus]|uniref:DNA ligase (ATP) n=2 Tax=Kineococcus aurantiacus TaxID=37633 RepID=A0A7Y9DMC3_9ACTN|nr:bifunctional non-homologous end joining protein LigD [Kineococcus aurantiacus]